MGRVELFLRFVACACRPKLEVDHLAFLQSLDDQPRRFRLILIDQPHFDARLAHHKVLERTAEQTRENERNQQNQDQCLWGLPEQPQVILDERRELSHAEALVPKRLAGQSKEDLFEVWRRNIQAL